MATFLSWFVICLQEISKDYEKPNVGTLLDSDSADDLCDFEVKGGDDEEKWDCQSILSTYSNIYNRPKLISERNSVRFPCNWSFDFTHTYS